MVAQVFYVAGLGDVLATPFHNTHELIALGLRLEHFEDAVRARTHTRIVGTETHGREIDHLIQCRFELRFEFIKRILQSLIFLGLHETQTKPFIVGHKVAAMGIADHLKDFAALITAKFRTP